MGARRASSGVYAAKARNHKPSLVRRVADHPLFEAVVYVAIIINAFLLASTAGEEDIKCHTGVYIAELCIFSVYLLELVVKLGAYGIDYFADGWNRLDFLVVCEGIYTYIISRIAFGCGKNLVQVLAVLRLLRILKPLRKIPYLRETRLLVSALLDSAQKVVIGCVVISMFIYFFAVVGNAYLAEKLDKRCVQSPFLESAFKGNDLDNFGNNVTYNTDTSRRGLREAWRGFPEPWKILNRDICGSCDTCRSCRGSYMVNTSQTSNLGPPGTPYKVTEYCIDVGYSIEGNKFKFNTVGWATLAVFDLMQLYGWDDPLWSSQDGAGASVWIYYYLLVGVLAFMALNIFPAIVSFELRKGIREDEKRRAGAVKKRREASREELGLTQLEDTVVDVLAAQRDDVAEIDRTLNGGAASGGGDGHPEGYYRAMWRRICDPPLGWFQLASYLVIVCQVILLACETPNMAPWRRGLLDGFTIFFQILWAGELALRLFAYGLKFFRDPFNTYDLVLFTLLLAGDFARLGAEVNRSAAWYEVITITIVLRLVNFARIGRLRRLTTPQMDLPRIVAIVTTSWRWLYNALFLLVFLMYFFAVLGMTLFRGRVYSVRGEAQLFWYRRNRAYRAVVDDTDGGDIAPNFFPYDWSKTCDPPMNCRGRFNFDTFGMAFLTVFVVVSQDQWNYIMYDAIRSKPKFIHSQALYSVVPYFVLLVLLRYIFVATIIAIIFDQVERDAVAVVRRDARVNMVSVFRLVGAQDKALKRRAFARWQGKAAPLRVGQPKESREGATYGDRGRGYVMLEENKEKPQTLWEQLRNDERSLYIFGPDHPVRLACVRVVKHPVWMYFMAAIVVIAVQTLAQELYWVHVKDWAGVSNRLPSLEVRNSWRALSNFTLAMFILEFFVEVVARGAWFPAKTAHLRSPLRRLDTGVTVIQFVGAFVSRGRAGHYLQMFEILRLLRLWQPLKLLARRSRAVSGVFAALDFGSGALLNVLMIVVVCFVLFAIMGMQLFMRTMQFCNDPGYPEGRNLDHVAPYGNVVKPLDYDEKYGNVERLSSDIYDAVGCHGYQVPYSEDCDIEALWLGQRCPVLWAKVHRYKYHFDAFWAALTTTARNFTFDTWVRNILDVVNGSWHKYRQPIAQSGSQAVAGFYFFLLGAASIIVTILFISVIYGTFTYVTISRRGKEVWRILTLRHAHWAFYRTKLETVKPIRELPPPSQGATKFSKGLYRFYHTSLYKFIYVSLVLLDVFGWTFAASGQATLVPTKHRNSDPQSRKPWFKVLLAFDIAICWLLVLDFTAKVLAFGRAHVFYYRREFFTMAALIPVAFHAFVQTLIACGANISAGFEAFAHACRATIVFLLVPFIPDAMNLFQVIGTAGMTILPLMLLALVVTYAFAIAGMMIYSSLMGFRIDAGEANTQKSFAAGRKNPYVRRIDFFTVAKSMNTLFVGATANQWVTFADLLRDNSSGRGAEKIHTWASWVFWSAYALFMRYLFMNLCTLVVIYKYERRAPEQPQIAMDQVREFKKAWLKYDPRGSGVIAPEALRDLVTELRPPLGVGPGAPLVIVNRHALRLLVALPPGALPGDNGEADRDARWRSLKGFEDLAESSLSRAGTQRQLVQPRASGALEAVRSEHVRAAPSDSSGGAPAAPEDADGMEPRSPVFDSAGSVEVSLDDEDLPVEAVARNVEAKRHYPFSFYSRANTERRLDDLGDSDDDDDELRATDLDALDALRATLKFRDAPPLAPCEALPACLRFRHVLIAAHRMAFFPDLQDLPDDDAVAARRASARTKLNVLRLGVDRHVVAQEAKEGANLLVLLAKKKDDAAQADLSRMRRVLPDLFRERLRHCLALETHRWQQRIGYAAFDDEAFAECELLCTILHDEHMATGLQVSVVDRLGARGALALLHERRPHLLRHERFLEELWARVRSVRGTYVLKSWRPEATYVAGKFPPFGAPVVSLVGTKNAKRLFALSGGRLTVWRRDSRWKPPHIRAREKQLHPSLDDAPEEEDPPQEEYEKAPETKEELEEREDDARMEAQKSKYEKSLEPEPLVKIFEADVPREEGAFVQAVAVSPDGTYVVVAAGPEVVRYKRKENTRKETYEIEATMAPSASYARSDVMALCVVNNRLFTGDARGTLRLWALRGAEPQKYAYLRDGISSLEVADEYALSLKEDGSGLKRRGLTLYAGMRDGSVGAMSVEFDQSWLLSTEAWEPAASVNAGAGVTCMTWHWDLLFVGTVAGAIAVIRPIRVSDETTHVASVAGDPDLDPIDAATKARRTLELRKILRLERVGVLNCHSRPVAQLAPCGNALYSASRDMALAAWRRPRVVIGTDGKGSLDARPPKPSITHEAPLTGLCPLAGLLATTDAKGVGQLHAAAEEDEEVVPPEAQTLIEPDDEEVLETPAFFYDGPLSKLTPRAFLAKLFWHYYPPTHTLHKPVSPTWRGKSHTKLGDEVSLDVDEDEESLSSYTSSYESGSETGSETGSEAGSEAASEAASGTGSEAGSSSYESYTGSSSGSYTDDQNALSADEDSNFGSDDIPASAYAGAAGAVVAGATVASPGAGGHSAELDYNGPELAHSAELDYQGADDLPELLPREAAQAPAPRGFARPGDLSAGGGVV